MTRNYVLHAEPAEYKLVPGEVVDLEFSLIQKVHTYHGDFDNLPLCKNLRELKAAPTAKQLYRMHVLHYSRYRNGVKYQVWAPVSNWSQEEPQPKIVCPPGFRVRDLIGLFVTRKFFETLAVTHEDALELYFEQLREGPRWKATIRRGVVYAEIARCCFAGVFLSLLSCFLKFKVRGGSASD